MDLDNKTLTLFKSFVSDICKVFPEHKECIDKNYCDILNKISEYTPNTDMEKIMIRFIHMQHDMVKEATNL